MVETALGIVGIALAILQSGYSAAVSEWGAFIDAGAIKLGKQLAKKMAENNALKEKLTNAYQEQNTNIINATFRGMGFGPRAAKLAEMRKKSTGEYQKKMDEINKQNIKYEQLRTQADNAAMLGGSSISGNIEGQKVINELNQNINGGTN